MDAWPGATFHGTVRQVRLNPTTVNNVVTYQSVIDVINTDLRLRPGMTTHFMVEAGRSSDVLRVPLAALRYTPSAVATLAFPDTVVPSTPVKAPNLAPGQSAVVWKVDGRKLTPVTVTIGRADGTLVEVRGGALVEGDTVITGIEIGRAHV